jgi:signal recognition particle subunit SRP54
MGPLQNVIGMLPGLPKEMKNAQVEDSEITKIEAIIRSMTLDERRNPNLVNGSRRLRIARGSGTATGDVNNLIKQFKQMQQMMRSMGIGPGGRKGKKGKKGKKGRLPALGA